MCDELWIEAEAAYERIDDQTRIPFAHADQIHVDDGPWDYEDEKICYNPAIYQKRGWCSTAGRGQTDWGMCSTSCQYFVRISNFALMILHILKKASDWCYVDRYIKFVGRRSR